MLTVPVPTSNRPADQLGMEVLYQGRIPSFIKRAAGLFPTPLDPPVSAEHPITAGDPRIPALDDELLLQLSRAASDHYWKLMNDPKLQRRLQHQIPSVLNDLLNECALRGINL